MIVLVSIPLSFYIENYVVYSFVYGSIMMALVPTNEMNVARNGDGFPIDVLTSRFKSFN